MYRRVEERCSEPEFQARFPARMSAHLPDLAMKRLIPLALAALATTLSAGDPPPTITEITPTHANIPGDVTVRGKYLGSIQLLTVDGVPATIKSAAPEELVIEPPLVLPGFRSVTALTDSGVSRPGELEAWPSLRCSVTRDTVDLAFGNGDDGPWIILASTDLRQAPYRLTSPPTDYLLMLPDDAWILASGWNPTTTPVILDFRVPPALQGIDLYLQGWARQRESATAPWRYSFTNLETAEL